VGITVGVAVLGSALATMGAQIATALGGAIQLAGAMVALRWARTEAPATTKEVCHA
jgi:hypothetical protein